jgi:hypothetical protein
MARCAQKSFASKQHVRGGHGELAGSSSVHVQDQLRAFAVTIRRSPALGDARSGGGSRAAFAFRSPISRNLVRIWVFGCPVDSW